MSDRSEGERALKFFYDESKKLYGDSFPYTFKKLLMVIDEKSKSFISGFGLGITFTRSSDTQIRYAMKDLAKLTKGGIPKNLNAFTQALNDELQEIDLEFLSNVAIDTIKDTTDTVAKVAIGAGGAYLAFLSIPLMLLLYGYLSKAK